MTPPPLVKVEGLSRRFGGVAALDKMDLEVASGAIHAVVGENGAGKSTLMKILAGAVRPDTGAIQLEGVPVTFDSPSAARRQGIGIVHQELSLFAERSVLANLFVNSEPHRFGFVSVAEMERASQPMLQQLGLEVDPHTLLSRLTIGERQLVELCRVLLSAPRLIILDEPNSALNKRETERLFTVLRSLRARGITMLYVSHRLEEVFSISDRLTVMRNGRDVRTDEIANLTIPMVIEAMLGRAPDRLFPPVPPYRGPTPRPFLTLRDLSAPGIGNVSISATAGEIIGLAGLEGSGASQLLKVLFGQVRATGGAATFPDGVGLPARPPVAARRGISLVPADRKANGLMRDKSILFNISNVITGALSSAPFRYRTMVAARRAAAQMKVLRIKAAGPETAANQLSGGNQQKVVLAKWLEIGPRVFLLDDPTRGVDVGAKREIYGLIRELAARGTDNSVLLL